MKTCANVQPLSQDELLTINGGAEVAIGTTTYFQAQDGTWMEDFYMCEYNWMTDTAYCLWASEQY